MTIIIAVTTANQSRNIYYRVYALDLYGNRGQSSNIATLFVPSDNSADTENSVLPPAMFWFLIGLGCLCLILIATIIGVCIYRNRKQKKKEDMGADWVQIGETTIASIKTPEKKNDVVQPEIPDFNASLSPFPRRRSSGEFFSGRLSEGGYSAGSSEIM